MTLMLSQNRRFHGYYKAMRRVPKTVSPLLTPQNGEQIA